MYRDYSAAPRVNFNGLINDKYDKYDEQYVSFLSVNSVLLCAIDYLLAIAQRRSHTRIYNEIIDMHICNVHM
jgi:hypothetical protein